MATKKWSRLTQALRAGIFVILGIVILAGALFVLGERQHLFQDRISIHAKYEDVAGLQEGAFVRIAGINVGTVSNIALPDSVGRVRVTMSIREDALSQIREDSKALIATEGLIGSRHISITPGSPRTPVVKPGAEITGQSPIRFSDYRADIERAVDTVDDVVLGAAAALASLSSVMAKIDTGDGTLAMLVNERTLYDTVRTTVMRVRRLVMASEALVNSVGMSTESLAGEASATLAGYRAVADSLGDVAAIAKRTGRTVSAIVDSVGRSRGTLYRLINDPSIANRADSILDRTSSAVAEITRASRSIAAAAERASGTVNELSDDLREGRGTFGKLVTDDTLYVRMNRAVSNLEIASEKLAVNMEAVRTNWFFRGYFEEQGYWDELDRKIELQEQRMMRLQEWEQRLLRLQQTLDRLERQIEERERRLRQTSPAGSTRSQE